MASNLKSGSSVSTLPYYWIFDINYHPNYRPYKHTRGICISPYVGPYSYGELNYCDRLHIILITFIYIITPLPTSTHKPVLARAPSSCTKGGMKRWTSGLESCKPAYTSVPIVASNWSTARFVWWTPETIQDQSPWTNGKPATHPSMKWTSLKFVLMSSNCDAAF